MYRDGTHQCVVDTDVSVSQDDLPVARQAPTKLTSGSRPRRTAGTTSRSAVPLPFVYGTETEVLAGSAPQSRLQKEKTGLDKDTTERVLARRPKGPKYPTRRLPSGVGDADSVLRIRTFPKSPSSEGKGQLLSTLFF